MVNKISECAKNYRGIYIIFNIHFSSENFLSSSLSGFFWHSKIQGEHKTKMEKCRKVR